MIIKYRGYVGNLDIDSDTRMVVGKVQNLRALLMYQGATVPEAIADFESVVDEYLSDCAQRGIEPEQAFAGVFQVRVSSKTHFALATEAAETQVALNTLVASVLDRHVSRTNSRGRLAAEDQDYTVKFFAMDSVVDELVMINPLLGKVSTFAFGLPVHIKSKEDLGVAEMTIENTIPFTANLRPASRH